MGQETVLGMTLAMSPIGESDRRLVLLTREKGKISAFARGASKPNSPLLGCSQTFAFGEYTLYAGRDSYSVRSARIHHYFSELREDLERLYYGIYFCEVADYYARENLDAEEMLRLLYQSLRALAKGAVPGELVRYIYEWRQMVINGEAPNVLSCQTCKRTDSLTTFSKRRHGLLCDGCASLGRHGGDADVLAATAYTLQFMTRTPVKELFSFTVTDRVLRELKRCVSDYLAEQVGRPFHALEQLRQL